jgi:single-strand DNA-binding protein
MQQGGGMPQQGGGFGGMPQQSMPQQGGGFGGMPQQGGGFGGMQQQGGGMGAFGGSGDASMQMQPGMGMPTAPGSFGQPPAEDKAAASFAGLDVFSSFGK